MKFFLSCVAAVALGLLSDGAWADGGVSTNLQDNGGEPNLGHEGQQFARDRASMEMIDPTGSVSGANTAQIAIVGAGPRGTSVVERLIANAPDLIPKGKRLIVHIIDPSGPGAGSVWRTNQSSELLMNVITSQVTLFPDKTAKSANHTGHGLSLYEWLRDEKPEWQYGPNDYATRVRCGEYLKQVFKNVTARPSSNIEVLVHINRAINLTDGALGLQTLTLNNGEMLNDLNAVVLTQGHLPLEPDDRENHDEEYAKKHQLTYIGPSNPADKTFSMLHAGEAVFLRGLGANFFDYMVLLTQGRGGRFGRTPKGVMYYNASGNEPRLYASSRRGIPYKAKGDNKKTSLGHHQSILLSDDIITGFRQRADKGNPPDFEKEIWPRIRKEVELVYYKSLLQCPEFPKKADFQKRFLAIPIPADGSEETKETNKLLDEFNVKQQQRWSWKRIQEPYYDKQFAYASEWDKWLARYLHDDAEEARQGNINSPTMAAIEVLRDLRKEVRLVVDFAGITGESRREFFSKRFAPLYGYLVAGPPRERIEQMIALLEANVLTVLGPNAIVLEDAGAWLARSVKVHGPAVRVTALIEARLPAPDLRRTKDELLKGLRESKQCRPHKVGNFMTGGVDITPSPFNLLNDKGEKHERRFVFGVLTEGVHWMTTVLPRPGVNSANLNGTNAIARASLALASRDLQTNESPPQIIVEL